MVDLCNLLFRQEAKNRYLPIILSRDKGKSSFTQGVWEYHRAGEMYGKEATTTGSFSQLLGRLLLFPVVCEKQGWLLLYICPASPQVRIGKNQLA